jgi:hypothetical protein
MEKGSKPTEPQKTYPEPTNSSDSVKYMQEVDAWFDELMKRSDQEDDTHTVSQATAMESKVV